MLNRLQISGLALLEDCALEFPDGLTVISGETGAGKTMILISMRLLTGGRAEPSLVKQGQKATEVDGTFTVTPRLAEQLEGSGYAVEDGEVIFSRTVAAQGRSRAAISARPVPARILSEMLDPYVTIHGQSDQFRLRGTSAQMSLLDTYAGKKHREVLKTYGVQWKKVVDLTRTLEELESSADMREVELRYLAEVIEAIEDLDPSPDEEEILDAAIDRLTNVEELRTITMGAIATLRGTEEPGALDLLGATVDALRKASRLDLSISSLQESAEALEIEAQSLIEDLTSYFDQQIDDPQQLSELHNRRAALTDLMRGRATTVGELLEWLAAARQRVQELRSESADPETVRTRLEEERAVLVGLAEEVSKSRRAAAKKLGRLVTKELHGLALRDATFFVEVEPVPLSVTGGDRVTMMLKPHPSAPATPLGQGASGGELSRIMLALEVVLADQDRGRTFVFDEIDAGIGGETIISVGERLRRLARDQQVIVVTHQPQIAALADRNFVVTKSGGTASVEEVEGERRTEEIVRMLGGESGTDATRRHAIELEERARVTQSKS